jgi:hypothetical protein
MVNASTSEGLSMLGIGDRMAYPTTSSVLWIIGGCAQRAQSISGCAANAGSKGVLNPA